MAGYISGYNFLNAKGMTSNTNVRWVSRLEVGINKGMYLGMGCLDGWGFVTQKQIPYTQLK
jgi:hypothetical protein